MQFRVRARVRRGCRPGALQGPPGDKGILFEVFGHRFLQNFRDSGFLREPQYLLCFNHILQVRAVTFSLAGASFLQHRARGALRNPLLTAPGTKTGANGGAKGGHGLPKGGPGATKIALKIDLGHAWALGGAPGGLGVPPRPENDPKPSTCNRSRRAKLARRSLKIRGSNALLHGT